MYVLKFALTDTNEDLSVELKKQLSNDCDINIYPVKPPVETDVLEFGGTFWTLSGERIPYMRDKTKDERFFILSLFAIAKELRQREALQPMVEAELAIGLPPEHYELRNQYGRHQS